MILGVVDLNLPKGAGKIFMLAWRNQRKNRKTLRLEVKLG